MKSIQWISVLVGIVLLIIFFTLNRSEDKSTAVNVKDEIKTEEKSLEKESTSFPEKLSDEMETISSDDKVKVNGKVSIPEPENLQSHISSDISSNQEIVIDDIGYKPDVDVIEPGSPGSPEALDQTRGQEMLDGISSPIEHTPEIEASLKSISGTTTQEIDKSTLDDIANTDKPQQQSMDGI